MTLSSAIVAPQQPAFAPGAKRVPSLSFAGQLAEGTTLIGTPIVQNLDLLDAFTIADEQLNAAPVEVEGVLDPAGVVVHWSAEVDQAPPGSVQGFLVTVSTSSSPAERLQGVLYVRVLTGPLGPAA